jgi:hypothetical protein
VFSGTALHQASPSFKHGTAEIFTPYFKFGSFHCDFLNVSKQSETKAGVTTANFLIFWHFVHLNIRVSHLSPARRIEMSGCIFLLEYLII